MDSIFGFVGKDFVIMAADACVQHSITVMLEKSSKLIEIAGNNIMAIVGEGGDPMHFSQHIKCSIKLQELRQDAESTVSSIAYFVRDRLAKAIRKDPLQVFCLVGGVSPQRIAPLPTAPPTGRRSPPSEISSHEEENPQPHHEIVEESDETAARETEEPLSPTYTETPSRIQASPNDAPIPYSETDGMAFHPHLSGTEYKSGEPQIFSIDYLGNLVQANYLACGYCAYFVHGLLDHKWRPNLSREEAVDLIREVCTELKHRYLVRPWKFMVKIADAHGYEDMIIEVD